MEKYYYHHLYFVKEETEIQALYLNLRCLISVPTLFKFISYLYYKALVEPHQESQGVTDLWPGGQAHEAGGIHVGHDRVFQKKPMTMSHGALAALNYNTKAHNQDFLQVMLR